MLASGRCHKSEDHINMQLRWNRLFVHLLVPTTRCRCRINARRDRAKVSEICQKCTSGTFLRSQYSSLIILTGNKTWQFLQSQSPRTEGDHWGMHSYEQRWKVKVHCPTLSWFALLWSAYYVMSKILYVLRVDSVHSFPSNIILLLTWWLFQTFYLKYVNYTCK